jgi:hypothetical protein
MVEKDELIFPESTLFHMPYKFIGLQCCRINIGFITVTDFKNPVIRGIGTTQAHHMINRPGIEFFIGDGKRSSSCVYIKTNHIVENFIVDYFPCIKRPVAQATKIIPNTQPDQAKRENENKYYFVETPHTANIKPLAVGFCSANGHKNKVFLKRWLYDFYLDR